MAGFDEIGTLCLAHCVCILFPAIEFKLIRSRPQCQPEAIAHLCSSCHVDTIIHDEVYSDLARASAESASGSLKASLIPWQASKTAITDIVTSSSSDIAVASLYSTGSKSVAYIHHTSGTSTGLPKPIPQTHHAGVGVLPCLTRSSKATFTTTPLYHGGVADCFRAWTSGDLIWLFPGGKLPITERNIISSLEAAAEVERNDKQSGSTVKYFSSVPYILQMMADDAEGLKWLQKMDIVGVGGAALPEMVGDNLVNQGVNLISRFGSAECGFLLSSHREYAADGNWQYLRAPRDSPYLKFEPQGDELGLSELVVQNGWPHMAKRNREDGSFATSDLFEPHSTIEGAWKYHSRSDSQITLVTGKKFDPAPVEDAIVAAMPEITDVLVFGNGKQSPGALIFVSGSIKTEEGEESLLARIHEVIEQINSKGQDHTRISKDMIVLKNEGKLMKSSKGTVLRGMAEKTYAHDIEAAYSTTNGSSESTADDRAALQIVEEAVQKVLGRHLNHTDDFYAQGVDSASCTRIRGLLERAIRGKPLPFNVIYDCGNQEKLAEYLEARRSGRDIEANRGSSQDMLDLVAKYRLPEQTAKKTTGSKPDTIDKITILLTGATGSLGAHILYQLIQSSMAQAVYCLVRAPNDKKANDRVNESLRKRKLATTSFEKVHTYAAQLEDDNLGLKPEVYMNLRKSVTHIVHAAWPVKFTLPLSSFTPSLQGLHNLLSLSQASTHNANFIFCSSTASVLGPHHNTHIKEKTSTAPEDSDSLGYSRSKWVAEAICSHAAGMLQDISIARIGQLTGDTRSGVWNMSEAYPLMLSTVRQSGCLPKINDKCSWLPVDIAAKAVLDIAFANSASHGDGSGEATLAGVYHVVNNSTETSFEDLLDWIKHTRKEDFKIVEPKEWMEKLESLDDHPAKALVGLWRNAYGGDEKVKEDDERVKFDTSEMARISPAMKEVKPVDRDLVEKLWTWIEDETSQTDL